MNDKTGNRCFAWLTGDLLIYDIVHLKTESSDQFEP